MNDFIELINLLCKRPGMYRINSVDDIYFIVEGYQIGCKPQQQALIDFMRNFRTFLNKDFESNKDFDWQDLIRLYSGGSNKHTIDLFKQKFDQYVESLRENN